jgi:Ala-tRNA(Pro) deacylase
MEVVMSISPLLENYLHTSGIGFEQVRHDPTFEALQSAQAAHVPAGKVAKGVLLETEDHCVMAVLPSSRQIDLDRLRQWIGGDVKLVGEQQLAEWFPDCEFGAIPPVGSAFGLETVLDDDILAETDIYFEGGDHETLVHVDGTGWRRLQRDAGHCSFAV